MGDMEDNFIPVKKDSKRLNGKGYTTLDFKISRYFCYLEELMNEISLKIGYDSENPHYLTSLLGGMGIKPNDRYKRSPIYLKNWSMMEAGRLLGKDVTQWETALANEIQRLDEIPKILERLRIEDEERLQNDPRIKSLNAKIDRLKTAIADYGSTEKDTPNVKGH